MKKIPLLPFFDLYAGTWNQRGLLTSIRTTYREDKSVHVINALGKHMLSVGTPSGLDLGTDCVLERLRSNNYDVDLILDYDSRVDGDLGGREHGYHSCWAGDGYQIAFKHRYPPVDGSPFEKYYNPAPNINDSQETPVIDVDGLREVVDTELGLGALYEMLPWLDPTLPRYKLTEWINHKVQRDLDEQKLPRKDLHDLDRLDGHYADWLNSFVTYQLDKTLPTFKLDVLTVRYLQALTGSSQRISWLSARLDAYEKAFGCEDMTVEEILNRHNNQPVSDNGTGNRSKAQFDEPDEPSLFVEGDDERLNPLWVLYTTNYHRGLLTKDQVENVGNNLLVQLQQCSPERLRELGPRGIPNVLTKFGHVSMAWVVYFKNTHQPNDLNFGQITRMGLTIAEQVKAYKPR